MKDQPAGASASGLSILHRSSAVALGEFRISASDRRWHELNRADDGHLIVFPGTTVWIAQAGRPAIVTDPNVVVLYNRDQLFRRGVIGGDGDRCAVVIASPALLEVTGRRWAARLGDVERRPFPVGWVRSEARTYLRHRLAVAVARRHGDPLWLETELIELVDEVIGSLGRDARRRTGGRAGRRHRAATRRARAELVKAAKIELAARLGDRLSLDVLAARLASSPYHLARVFRTETGASLHGYRDELRLRASLERLADERASITEIGLGLGYASSSHFADAFRRRFLVAPSEVRRQSTAGRVARDLALADDARPN
jgi:AraC family transcriptional regulator